MSEFIVRACKNIIGSCYLGDKEDMSESSDTTINEKCLTCDIKDCRLKEIARNLLRVVRSNTCSRCDGCGYIEGCADVECGTYEAYKCLDLLNIEFVGDEQDDI